MSEARPVQLLFMGRLQPLAGAATRELALSGSTRLSQLVAQLAAADNDLGTALGEPSIRVAINAVIVPRNEDPAVLPGDEVAFMPPFSGG
jgi:molybdopterin synthase sulfur carrier subunit